jgi:hypothetical protein
MLHDSVMTQEEPIYDKLISMLQKKDQNSSFLTQGPRRTKLGQKWMEDIKVPKMNESPT